MDHHMPLRVLLSLLVVALATSLEAEELRSGITTENFDRRVRPQDNLFGHVNGQWP